MNIESVKSVCDMIAAAEKDAARLLMEAHDILSETKSGSRDVVTEYDRRVQLFLEERIRQALPEAHFFCEELGEREDLSSEHMFVIDPIDGTMNFVRGFNHSCISIAYAHRGIFCAAAVYNPYTDELFTAVKGAGACLNGKRLLIEDRSLADSVVCFGTAPYYPEFYERTFRLTEAAFRAALDIRREGSAELDLCSVAASRAGVFFEYKLSMWDYAAGALIISEAGGRCCALDGSELPYDGRASSVAAGAPTALEELLRLAQNCL